MGIMLDITREYCNATQSRAEQSRAEQSRAEQYNYVVKTIFLKENTFNKALMSI